MLVPMKKVLPPGKPDGHLAENDAGRFPLSHFLPSLS